MAELQQPNIVGNFLAAYSSGLERQQQQQDAAYQRQRQAKADERLDQQWQWQMDDRQIAAARQRADRIAAVAQMSDTPEKWAVNVPAVMQELGIDGPAPDFATREAKIAEALGLKDMLDLQFKNREAARMDRVANANIAQSLAAARASNRQGQGGGGSGIDNKTFDNISSLRKEWQGVTKDFGTVRDAFGRIQATSKAATPASDISMIYAYMKMLDPGSVVRETEFSTAQNAKPLLDRLGLSWESVKSAWEGTRLQPNVRQDFLNRANELYTQQLGQYENNKQTYDNLSRSFGFDPQLVLTDQTGGLKGLNEESPPQFSGSGLLGGLNSTYTPYSSNNPASGTGATNSVPYKTKRGNNVIIVGK